MRITNGTKMSLIVKREEAADNKLEKNPAAVSLGKMGGSAKSAAKAAAARENGKKGGRPRKTKKEMDKMDKEIQEMIEQDVKDGKLWKDDAGTYFLIQN